MSKLSNAVLKDLIQKGIHIDESDPDGVFVKFDTVGLYWVFNYLNLTERSYSSFSLKLLKDVASFGRNGEFRELRMKAFKVPVYDGDVYMQLAVYLNGTPPRKYTAIPPAANDMNKVNGLIEIPLSTGGVFKNNEELYLAISLTDDQADQLTRNEFVVVR
jgi:hypothetical protein